jgi:molybdopterin converting factor small subunit
MESIEKQIEKQLNIIIDRYERLRVPFKNLRRYLTGKNISTVIDELSELEEIYLKRYKDKDEKDFKILVKSLIIDIIKDRSYAYMDKNESRKIKTFENFNPHQK